MNSATATQTDRSDAGRPPMIGIVEDDPIMGESLVQRLELEGSLRLHSARHKGTISLIWELPRVGLINIFNSHMGCGTKMS